MKNERFWKKILAVLLAITVLGVAIICVADVIYDCWMKSDEATLLESYESKKEKCELIKAIPNDFIEEDKGINLQEIPDNIRYEIKNNNDGNIEFYYYIEPESSSASNPYKAWIILSKDYEVIEEEYGNIELEDFETFKQKEERSDLFLAYWISAASIWMAFLVIVLIAIITCHIKKKKSRS